MAEFTGWIYVNTVSGIVDYVINWYEYLAGAPSSANDNGCDNGEEEWGQFVIIDEGHDEGHV